MEELRTRLRAFLQGRTGLVEAFVEVGEGTYRITHPAAADALIDEEDFARDERLPYWAELWPSAVALARRVIKEDLAGRRVVELGCGLGLPSIIALACGAEVIATDHYDAALSFVRYNAHANLGLELETRLLDWHRPETKRFGPFDLILAADVLYEPRNVPALAALIPTLLGLEGEVLLADPRRKDAPTFFKKMQDRGFHLSTEEYLVPSGAQSITVLVHQLRP